MTETKQSSTGHLPTMLETQLDSICLMLGQMKSKVRSLAPMQHMTETERSELEAALMRAEMQMNELSEAIRGRA